MSAGDEPLKLDSLQRDLLVPQIQAFLEATSDPAARAVYGALQAAVEKLEVGPALAERLGAIIEIALASGRVRKLFGAGAELALSALFQKTPRGREIAASIDSVNAALAKLRGQPLAEASAALRKPGSYAITLRAGGHQIVIRFEQGAVVVESIEVDL